MSGTVRRQFKRMFFVVFCFVVSEGLFRPLPVADADVRSDVFHVALNDNLQAEALLQNEIRASHQVISRPNSEYLLYQKSLGLKEAKANLRQLRFERTALIQELNAANGVEGFPFQAGFNVIPASGNLLSAVYSGAPMLSFDDGSRHSLRVVSEKMGFYRLLTGAFLATAFSLPLLALYKKKTEVPGGKKLVRVFPIFSWREKNGERGLFKVPVNRHEILRAKFGA